MKAAATSARYSVFSVLATLLLALNFYVTKVFVVLGSPMLFALALLGQIILIIFFLYNLIRALATPEKIVKSLLDSMWGGLKTNPYVNNIRESNSPPLLWAGRRLKRKTPTGLPLTITLFVSFFFFFNFLSILSSVSGHSSLTQIDLRVLNLMPNIRTPLQTSLMRIVTSLANIQAVIVFLLVAVALLWLKHQRVLAAVLILLAGGEESATFLLKHLIHRLRPGISLRLIGEDGFSFPSGHVVRATVLFGFLTYLLYRSWRSKKARILTLLIYFLAVFLVAISRIYLGVHYPTDVWASFLLGCAILTLTIGLIEIQIRYVKDGTKKFLGVDKLLLIAPVVLIVFAISAASTLIPLKHFAGRPTTITLHTIDARSVAKLPLYSETLTGSRMEPINFIYIGNEAQIIAIFAKHGWYRADKSTVSNTLKAIAVGFQGKQYLTAPVTPSYLDSQPENLAFQHPTASHSLKQRHHTRIWRTNYVLADGRQIWVATASFDQGIEFVGAAKLPTHHIDPNIDGERGFIINSLNIATDFVPVVAPQLGKNASGDGFFTDGKAELVYLN